MNAKACELMLKYLDGSLEGQGISELNHRLAADPDFCRAAVWFLVQELQLRELGKEQRMRAAEWDPERSGVVEAVNCGGWRGAAKKLRVYWPWAVAASLALLTAGFLLLRGNWLASGRPKLGSIEGAAEIDRNGVRFAAAAGTFLIPGDLLLLKRDASVLLRYAGELTWLRFSGPAEARIVSIGKAKAVSLLTGSLSAVVGPQSVRFPMRLVTPHAEANVLGTQLSLSTGPEVTRLDVWEGKVRMTQTADGSSVNVETDHFAVAGSNILLSKSAIRHGVLREFWLTPGPSGVVDLADEPCLGTVPVGWEYLADFEAPTDSGDRFIARFRTFLRPPISGEYHFWIAGDDAAELWLSRNENPEHKVKICSTSQWTGPTDWDRSASQRSRAISLEAGRTYYLEALQREAAGGDSATVGWLIPGKQREILRGEYATPGLPPDATAGNQPERP